MRPHTAPFTGQERSNGYGHLRESTHVVGGTTLVPPMGDLRLSMDPEDPPRKLTAAEELSLTRDFEVEHHHDDLATLERAFEIVTAELRALEVSQQRLSIRRFVLRRMIAERSEQQRKLT